MKRLFSLMLVIVLVFTFVSCKDEKANDNETSSLTAVCSNGKFIGKLEDETGVLSFKGIPYAKAPIGELRWKAPEAPDPSDEYIEAFEYGKSAIQYYWFSEDIKTDVGEDCLTLNVWTKDLSGKDKPVMVFFHGGAFAWGGSSEPKYNGQYIVNEHDDVIVVTCNYRFGMMGFIDLSSVPGSEEYSDSTQLGLLDCIESLKWIKENIQAFGGNPNNITIFGESAGSTIVACLLASDYAGDLFQRAICESGSLCLTNDKTQYEERTDQIDALLYLSEANNMDELLALTEEELIELNEYPLDEYETSINDLYMMPFRGGLVPEDPYQALENAKAKNVDVIIGTTYDECKYWISEMTDRSLSKLSEEEINECIESFNDYLLVNKLDDAFESLNSDEKKAIYDYIESADDEMDARALILNECMFRASSIKMAEYHSRGNGTGKTYMYLFGKENSMYPFLGACHSTELSYVFHYLETDDYSGVVDVDLADRICEAWVNFAKTGDPSVGSVAWTEYDANDRNTLVVDNDGNMKMISDPLQEERLLTRSFADIYSTSMGL